MDMPQEYRTQQEYLDLESACKCLIHHPINEYELKQAMEIMRTGTAFQAAIAAQMLSGCPSRLEK